VRRIKELEAQNANLAQEKLNEYEILKVKLEQVYPDRDEINSTLQKRAEELEVEVAHLTADKNELQIIIEELAGQTASLAREKTAAQMQVSQCRNENEVVNKGNADLRIAVSPHQKTIT
jgi:hypothetical protein